MDGAGSKQNSGSVEISNVKYICFYFTWVLVSAPSLSQDVIKRIKVKVSAASEVSIQK